MRFTPNQSTLTQIQIFFIDSIESKVKQDQAFAKLLVGPNSTPVNFKLDTGSQVGIIPEKVYDKLGVIGILQNPTIKLTAYNGHTLSTLGICRLACRKANNTQTIEFYFVDTTRSPILGLKSCLDFELIKLIHSVDSLDPRVHTNPSDKELKPIGNNGDDSKPLDKKLVTQQYNDVFQGIGLFPGECKIHEDQNIHPVVHPPRRVPFALHDKLKSEHERMEQTEIITKVSTPTEWVNSLVIVEKPKSGKLHICLDPQDLNRTIMRPHYPMRTLEDVIPLLSGAKFFTKLDARSGYWAIKLCEESSYLTTFNTPLGRYRFFRLPFGLKSSQDEFQRKIDEFFEGLIGIVAIVDDILVFGHTQEEHDNNLRAILERAREKGVKLNEDKLEVGVFKLEYFDHIVTSEGLKPDPAKVTAVQDMQPLLIKQSLKPSLIW